MFFWGVLFIDEKNDFDAKITVFNWEQLIIAVRQI